MRVGVAACEASSSTVLALARKGAHDPASSTPITDGDVDALCVTGQPTVLVTLSAQNATPERVRRLAGAGVVVSLGRSGAAFAVVPSHS